ncbi:hypothetical protein C5N14_16600 [Micromonospora sp. MW-13]|uniref:hypothetical protein n=1 Tax=unclassified Micromonospora TaxID=2617518 RepID=UPI000E44237C|nr:MULTISPECIES: hypothetical protein [unclassified Micromonospora]MCX4470849.1 hypothetical protein [Micromonospora sp. NBC_01655]RGC67828.1 hypothetical protein C5N14_16600 [Micromonospora sp. MW-13]
MQRRLVALAPLLACALLLHVSFACRSPLTTTAQGPVAAHAAATPEPETAAHPGRVTLEARPAVATLHARTDRSPAGTVVAGFDGKACGSVTRSGRGAQSTDRRDSVAQVTSALPDTHLRRDNTADGRPLTVDAGPDPVRLSILRC